MDVETLMDSIEMLDVEVIDHVEYIPKEDLIDAIYELLEKRSVEIVDEYR